MPRVSKRLKTIKSIQHVLNSRETQALKRKLLDEHDPFEDLYDIQTKHVLNRIKRTRYLYRKKKYRTRRCNFDLEDVLSPNSERYNESEFLYDFRLKRESFFLLLEQVETADAFKFSKYKKQRPIAFQLLVFLFRVGKEGSAGSASAVASHFKIGRGSVHNYVRRTVKALHEIKESVVYWPDDTEKEEMKNRLSALGFRHCIGIIDGTLIMLDTQPEKFHECYYSRKSCYALNVMVICDDRKRITYYYAGWPGSTHDNRVFRHSKVFMKRNEFFKFGEYLLGDSAYSESSIMVQAFKKQKAQAELPRSEEFFNTMLAHVRISSEHCIGLLKGRFPSMKRTNIRLKEGKKEVKQLVDLIGACCVIHNLMIKYDDDAIPKEWYDEMKETINWNLYDEEQEEIDPVETEGSNRRETVYNSIINNYFI
jgi:hypothetical protein